jgi:hypothetical protein
MNLKNQLNGSTVQPQLKAEPLKRKYRTPICFGGASHEVMHAMRTKPVLHNFMFVAATDCEHCLREVAEEFQRFISRQSKRERCATDLKHS